MVVLRNAHPPHFGVEIECWTLDRPTQLSALRGALRTAVVGIPAAHLSDHVTMSENIVFVATELTSNALKHGAPPAIVRLSRSDTHLVLDVADHDPSTEPEYAAHRPAGTGGLGLRLVVRMATDLGWYRAGTTKHVWAGFSLAHRTS
ncbi:hypothetical protein Adi01nite_70920 [Amorphoplanes digitatis]|nr:hypothetical protein GCM10020092_032770 [Actinoplanes digitatis]GID97680.1 hypothetical protein Adi01nite_70920 [Actinoplanes digitatis]